jgi:glucose-1-phosphate adenylyltransferase
MDWQSNNPPFQINLIEPSGDSYQGSADAVFRTLPLLPIRPESNVIILAADHIYAMDYRKLVDYHQRKGAGLTVGSVVVPQAEVRRFGSIVTSSDGRITRFVEKSANPPSNLVSTGIYVFRGSVLSSVLMGDNGNSFSRHDFGYDIIPQLTQRGLAYAFTFSGYWKDIGTVEAYHSTQTDKTIPSAILGNNDWPIRTARAPLSKGQDKSAVIENSVISPGVSLGTGARVRRSVLMSGVKVGANTVIEDCVIDEYCEIGQYSYLGFGNCVGDRSNITVVGTRANIPAGIAISKNCTIMPDVVPSDFSRRVIPRGSVIDHGVEVTAGSKVLELRS